jgi:hypothetical protein
MKYANRLILILAAFLSLAAAAETILVMDTIEFNTLRHSVGRWQYITKLTDVLKKMRLKEGDFDAMNSDKQVVYELIQSKRWDKISAEIEKQCKKKEQKANCNALAKIRLDTFDYIKDNPEGVEETSSTGTVNR